MKQIIYLLLSLALLSSCGSVKQTQESNAERDHLIEVNKMIHDSIYVHQTDSVFILVHGDTVTIDRYHTLYKYVGKTDTLTRVDTLRVIETLTETKMIEVNKLTSWQQTRIRIGNYALGLIGLILIYLFLKWRLKH
ncbi:MAG: hypothetical protein LBN93_10590 [Candidatus Symbiothrix sp.]|jgi:hypothetical protein|nr:hypothetical protein [Candidatus Symbiothrix sp.]